MLKVGSATLTPFTTVLTPLSFTLTVFTVLSHVTVNTWFTTLMLQAGVTRGSNSSTWSSVRGRDLAAARPACWTDCDRRFHIRNQRLRNMRNLLTEKGNQENPQGARLDQPGLPPPGGNRLSELVNVDSPCRKGVGETRRADRDRSGFKQD